MSVYVIAGVIAALGLALAWFAPRVPSLHWTRGGERHDWSVAAASALYLFALQAATIIVLAVFVLVSAATMVVAEASRRRAEQGGARRRVHWRTPVDLQAALIGPVDPDRREAPQIYLSFAADDEGAALEIKRALESEGFAVTAVSSDFDIGVFGKVYSAPCILVCLSRKALESHRVRSDIGVGRHRNALLVAVIEPGASLDGDAPMFRLAEGSGDEWRRLVSHAHGLIESASQSEAPPLQASA